MSAPELSESIAMLALLLFFSRLTNVAPAGQQQILCLARIILEQPKVVCLDEATANVDPDTARLMQQVLRTHLHYSTVLQIAHRLDAILDCDWTVVMDQGRVVEQGPPQELLKDQQSHFAALYQAAAAGNV